MPLELPNLDDRTYDDLVAEALSLIPNYAPDWTNHNPSDPGIMLIELFAYLTEMQLYRQNRITEANIRSFLKLLKGSTQETSESDPSPVTGDLQADLQETISQLRKRDRAVSRQDFVFLAKEADERVARAYCLPRRDLRMNFETERAGYVGLIVIPKKENEAELPEIINFVNNYLEPRRLLTTRLNVLGPQFLEVRVHLTVVPLPDVLEIVLQARVKKALNDFFDPWIGGQEGNGWTFGRSIFVSEICALVDQISGVDSVDEVELEKIESNVTDRQIAKDGRLIGLELKPYELVKVKEADIGVKVGKKPD